MGLLDGILGNLTGSTGDSADPQGSDSFAGLLGNVGAGAKEKGAGLMAAAMSLVQDDGGLHAVLDKFRQNGMVEQVESWIGTGPNQGITMEQVRKVIDPARLSEIASRLGVTTEQAGAAFARILPELVNRLTPDGRVPENPKDLIAEGLAKIKSWNA